MKNKIYILFGALITICGCVSLNHQPETDYAKVMLKNIQRYIPQIQPLNINPAQTNNLAGYYSGQAFSCKINQPSGKDIYIFPDNTYYLMRWDASRPTIIIDSGVWSWQNGLLRLKTDKTLKPLVTIQDTIFLPLVYLKDKTVTQLLLGVEDSYPKLLAILEAAPKKSIVKECVNDFTLALDLYTFYRKNEINPQSYKTVKNGLFKMFWPQEQIIDH